MNLKRSLGWTAARSFCQVVVLRRPYPRNISWHQKVQRTLLRTPSSISKKLSCGVGGPFISLTGNFVFFRRSFQRFSWLLKLKGEPKEQPFWGTSPHETCNMIGARLMERPLLWLGHVNQGRFAVCAPLPIQRKMCFAGLVCAKARA